MALSSLFRSSSQPKQASGSDGILSMPSARAILLSSVGCMLVLSLLMVASASIPFALSRGMTGCTFQKPAAVYDDRFDGRYGFLLQRVFANTI